MRVVWSEFAKRGVSLLSIIASGYLYYPLQMGHSPKKKMVNPTVKLPFLAFSNPFQLHNQFFSTVRLNTLI